MNEGCYCLDSPVNEWFELTYSSYLVLPRLFLQSMPIEWQKKFIDLIEQIPETLDIDTSYTSNYLVKPRINGKFVKDIYSDYRRGKVKLKEEVRNGMDQR